MSDKNKKTFTLNHQQIVDAFAQYLYDHGLIGNDEAEGSLVYELLEKDQVIEAWNVLLSDKLNRI